MSYMAIKIILRARDEHLLVGVKVQQFDAAWSRETDLYVGPHGRIKNGGEAHRYFYFGHWLAIRDPQEEHVIAPIIHVCEDGSVGFENGRHRFAFLRDHGVNVMPVAMTPDAIENARRYGYLHHVYATRVRTIRGRSDN
jgi:hypothetical protein